VARQSRPRIASSKRTQGGDGQLELDIDYILEWLRPSESTFAFRVAPAALTFIDVRTWTYT